MRPKAVLLDALGTLVQLRPPAPRLRARLAAEGFDVSDELAREAIAAEIAYYLAHHMEGRDPESLDDLRDRCAQAMMQVLALPELGLATARRALMAALEFEAYPDAPPALRALREAGLTLVVASNWDCALPDWLDAAGLLELMDGVVTSAEAGVVKPAPGIFEKALEVAGVAPHAAVHVGDSLSNDVEGARAAGLRAVLVARDGESPEGVEAVRSLAEVPSLILSR